MLACSTGQPGPSVVVMRYAW